MLLTSANPPSTPFRRIVKSLTDFRVLGSFTLGLELNPSYPASSPRKYLVRSLVGKKLDITPDSPTNPEIQELIDGLLKDIGKTLDKPACFTVSEWDCRSEIVRALPPTKVGVFNLPPRNAD